MDWKKIGLVVICSILIVTASGCVTPDASNYTQGYNDGVRSILKSCYNSTVDSCIAMSAVKDGACILVIANNSQCKLPE